MILPACNMLKRFLPHGAIQLSSTEEERFIERAVEHEARMQARRDRVLATEARQIERFGTDGVS